MVILASLALFTIPTYQLVLSQVELNGAVNDVTDFIRHAAQRTVTEQIVYGVTMNSGASSIVMYQLNGNTKTTVATQNLPTNMQVGTVSFGGATSVSFTTVGAPSVSGFLTIKDVNRNKSREIDIRPSGNIRNNQGEQ